jgi:hypothetical protein
MTEARAQSLESETAGNRLGLETLLVGSVPDLLSAAVSPAEGPVGGGDRAGMKISGAHLLKELPACHEPGLEAVGHRAVAQLAASIGAPAESPVGHGHRARVSAPGAQGTKGPSTMDRDGYRAVRHPAVTELAGFSRVGPYHVRRVTARCRENVQQYREHPGWTR